MSLKEMIRAGDSISAIEKSLDALEHTQRMQQIYELSGKDESKLYELSVGRYCDLNYFVPKGQHDKEVIHWGYNSLPTFRKFQKRMMSANGGKTVKYSGYNEQALRPVTGPGYFGLRNDKSGPHQKEQVVIDYVQEPDFKYESWPEIQSNKAKLSRFIYFETQDWMWKVSKHVSIGRASKNGKFMDAWFVLCRED